MTILIIWFTLFGLVILSFQSNGSIPLWIPLALWVLGVIFRTMQRWGNYKDDLKQNRRDEKIELEDQGEKEAQSGTAFSSGRIERERKIKDDFEYKRRKLKRKFRVDLMNTFFLK